MLRILTIRMNHIQRIIFLKNYILMMMLMYDIKKNCWFFCLKDLTTAQTLLLAYQSLGVVYGDIGTSPLYTFPSITLSNPQELDLLGVLSLIYWTLTVMALLKYVLIVLRADDHGEGDKHLNTYI